MKTEKVFIILNCNIHYHIMKKNDSAIFILTFGFSFYLCRSVAMVVERAG